MTNLDKLKESQEKQLEGLRGVIDFYREILIKNLRSDYDFYLAEETKEPLNHDWTNYYNALIGYRTVYKNIKGGEK